MMGRQPPPQPQLFYTRFNLEKRIRSDHPLRKIAGSVDLDFVYAEVGQSYGSNGNVSVPPPVILKLMLLLTFYNVRSERELMETLPERLDWLWFLGWDIDTEMPNHSVLSKARRRWGVEIFKKLFERVVWQCVEAGLVDGSKLFMDSSLIEANASNNSIVDRESLERYVRKGYQEFEQRLQKEEDDEDEGKGQVNQRHISMTDPDAAVIRQRGTIKPKPRYKTHRAVDGAHEVITATEVTSGGLRQEEIDVMRDQVRSWRSRRDIFIRQHLMERSFARSTRYGFKQSRWRRIWRVRIQDYLTAAVQNMKILIDHGLRSPRAIGSCLPLAPRITLGSSSKAFLRFVNIIFSLGDGRQPAF